MCRFAASLSGKVKMSNFYQMCADRSSKECNVDRNQCGIDFKYQNVGENLTIGDVIGEFFDATELISCKDAETRLSLVKPINVAYFSHGILGGVILILIGVVAYLTTRLCKKQKMARVNRFSLTCNNDVALNSCLRRKLYLFRKLRISRENKSPHCHRRIISTISTTRSRDRSHCGRIMFTTTPTDKMTPVSN